MPVDNSLFLSTDQKRAVLFGNIHLYNSTFYQKIKAESPMNKVLLAKIAYLDNERSYKNVTEWVNNENKILIQIRPNLNDHLYVCQSRYDSAKKYIAVLESLLPEDIKEKLAKGINLPTVKPKTVEDTYKRILKTGNP